MKPGAWWPPIIVGALAVHVVVSLVVVYVATSDPSYAVEEDYYQKAVDWDEKRARDRTSKDLGWLLDFAVTPPERPGEQPLLEVRLSEAGGEILTGATIKIEAFHKARGDDIVRETLNEVGGGVYSATPSMNRNGRWEMRFTVDLGDDHFTHAETRHLFVEGNW